jgi:hypothetical protein
MFTAFKQRNECPREGFFLYCLVLAPLYAAAMKQIHISNLLLFLAVINLRNKKK